MLCPYHCLLFVMFSLRMFFFKEIKKLEFTPHEPQATCHRHRKNPRENLFRMYGHTSTLFSKNGAEKKKKNLSFAQRKRFLPYLAIRNVLNHG